MTGSRHSKLRSDNAVARSAATLRREGKMFAKFERIIKTANAHFD
jgi:hypothetical protein